MISWLILLKSQGCIVSSKSNSDLYHIFYFHFLILPAIDEVHLIINWILQVADTWGNTFPHGHDAQAHLCSSTSQVQVTQVALEGSDCCSLQVGLVLLRGIIIEYFLDHFISWSGQNALDGFSFNWISNQGSSGMAVDQVNLTGIPT